MPDCVRRLQHDDAGYLGRVDAIGAGLEAGDYPASADHDFLARAGGPGNGVLLGSGVLGAERERVFSIR